MGRLAGTGERLGRHRGDYPCDLTVHGQGGENHGEAGPGADQATALASVARQLCPSDQEQETADLWTPLPLWPVPCR